MNLSQEVDHTIPSGNDTNPLSEGEEGESQNNTNAQITPSVTLSTADREAFKRVFNLICPEATDKQRKKDHHLCPWQTNPNANREVPQWGDPPQLSLAVENLAGILQNNRGSPVVLQGRLCSRLTKKSLFLNLIDQYIAKGSLLNLDRPKFISKLHEPYTYLYTRWGMISPICSKQYTTNVGHQLFFNISILSRYL